MIASVEAPWEWADQEIQIIRRAGGFPLLTQHPSLPYNDDFYFLKRKSVCDSRLSTSDLEIVAAAVPGGSEYNIMAPTARHTAGPEEPGSGCLSTERPWCALLCIPASAFHSFVVAVR